MLLLLALACAGDAAHGPRYPTDVQVEVADTVGTLFKVTWTTAEPTVGYVEYGPTGAYGHVTPLEDTPRTDHTVPVVGLVGDTDYHLRVVVPSDDGAEASQDVVATTDPVPVELPELTVSGDATWTGWLLVPIGGAFNGPVLIDPEGNITWYLPEDRTSLKYIRARMSDDHGGILYNAIGHDDTTNGELVKVSWDGRERGLLQLPDINHDFWILPDGTLATLRYDNRQVDGQSVRGDQIVEVAPDGTERVVWSVWDTFDPAGATLEEDGTWTHANALDWVEVENAYYVGLRNLDKIVCVDRDAGTVRWEFGGKLGDVAVDGTFFNWQHQFARFDDRLLVFDNGESSEEGSRVVEYRFDPNTRVAEETRSYEGDVWAYALGDVERLPNGHTLVNWGTAGRFQELTPDGEVVWQLDVDLGYGIGYMEHLEDLYGLGD